MAAPGGAGPWGGAVLERVRAAVAKGWPSGLTVLTGDDLFHLDRAQRAILEALGADPADPYSCTVFGDAPVAAGELVGAARSTGMFAKRRIVLVRDASAIQGDPEPLAAFAASPPESGYLLIRAPKLDRKRKLGKALAESPRCLVFRAAEDADRAALVRVIETLAREHRLELPRATIDLLVEVCGSDLHRIEREIEKLDLFLPGEGPGRSVDVATLRSLLAGAALLSGWELSGALLARDRVAGLEAARRLVDAGEEPIRIVGGLAWRARTLLKAKAMSDAGAPPREVVAAARAWSQERELTRGLSRYRLADLLAMPGRLLSADRALKSRSIDPRAVLEQLVLDLIPASEAAPR
jgi:DNA polymerase III subunit delta